ncbi:SRPBCC family protein [Sunxiuqinia sp. A32]|uniref:SRPBCC family protein n=1 Tax=Sunxiuqinia sp. A32 TaxID=3461496 RepID=UPI0040455FD4
MNKTTFETNGSELTVIRTFNAPLSLVWRAWTEAELLDKWWAPKPWKSETSYMDFKEGGHRIYDMIGPEGERHGGRTDYLHIQEHKNFSGKDFFLNDEININPNMPIAQFQNQFEPKVNETVVTIKTQYTSEEQLKQVLEMGMKEGLSMAFENLDQVLANAPTTDASTHG